MPLTLPIEPTEAFYVAGGNLMPNAHSYVVRPADDELFESMRDGYYSYVLTSRQMGKSSLMHRTALRLQENGITPVLLDLTSIGANITLEQWYFGLLAEIGSQLRLKAELERYWTENALHGPLYRFTHALSEVVLANIDGPIAVFIDEIDFVRGLRFSTDEFFAAIRHCHNDRARDPAMRRLTFCLLGVATPADLIRDVNTTPFNIGRQIELTDFSRGESAQLESGLSPDPAVARSLLDRVMFWTSGHPYLTQKLCLAVSQRPKPTAADVDALCHDLFLTSGRRSSEDNLIFVHNTLRSGSQEPIAVINRYRRVLAGKDVLNDPSDPIAAQLRLAGVVRAADGRLRVRNRIYGAVFNRRWVEENLPDAELRRERAAYRRGLLTAIAVSVAIVAVMAVLFYRTLAAERRANFEHAKVVRELAESNYTRAIGDISQAQEALDEPNIPRAEALLTESNDLTKGAARSRSDWLYLWHQCHGETNTFKCPASVLAVCPIAKGVVAAVCTDGELREWSTSGQSCRTIPLGITPIAAAFAVDDREVAVASAAGTIKVLDIASAHTIRTIETKSPNVFRVAIAADRRTLIWQKDAGEAGLSDISTGEPVGSIKRPGDHVTALSVSGDGRTIAVGFFSGRVVWRAKQPDNRAVERQFQITFPVSALAISPNATYLAVGDFSGGVYIYDFANQRFLRRMRGRPRTVECIAFSPNGKTVLSGGNDTQLHLWNTSTGVEAGKFSSHLARVICAAFDYDSEHFISGSVDGDVKVWNASTDPAPLPVKGLNEPLQLSQTFVNDHSLVVNMSDGTVQMWDIDHARLAWTIPMNDFRDRSQVVATGPVVVIERPYGKMEVRSTWDGRLLHVWPTGQADCIAMNPDGKHVALVQGESVSVWNILTGKIEACFSGAPPSTQHLAFSPNGDWLAAGGRGDTIRIWRLKDPAHYICLTLPGPLDQNISTVVFDRSSTRLAAASDDLQAAVWTIPSGTRLGTIVLPSQVFDGLMLFSPDQNEIITGDEDGGVKIWDVRIGSETVSLSNDSPNVAQLHISSDGASLSASDGGGCIRRWRWD